ncbi:GPI inositol deacylase [Lobosporangium transversale]|nr:GPI inositol deacylase [Lobosporangium transversale]
MPETSIPPPSFDSPDPTLGIKPRSAQSTNELTYEKHNDNQLETLNEWMHPSAILHQSQPYSAAFYGCSFRLFALFLISAVLLACAIHSSFHYQLDPKGCMMTYMQPTYYRLLDFNLENTYTPGNYGLLLYRDEGDDHSVVHPDSLEHLGGTDWAVSKSAKIRPTGIPALFIPGNAGSARQIRSLARETTTAYKPGSKRIDFFTVDFNEEFSAFHGQILVYQAKWINTAIKYILSLYNDHDSDSQQPRPTSILIVGHSMGGIVARTIFIMENYLPGSVRSILTLATPHMVPPLVLDYGITKVYDKIEDFWAKGYSGPNAALTNVSIVSIMGGNQDLTVNSDAGNIHHLVPLSHGFSVFTSAIPHAWVGSDHLSILWCNQIVKQVGKVLADIVDPTRAEQVRPLKERMEILKRHLIADKGDDPSDEIEDEEIIYLPDVKHTFLTKNTIWTNELQINRRKSPHYYILSSPLQHNKEDNLDTFTFLTDQEFGPHKHFRFLLCKDTSVAASASAEADEKGHISSLSCKRSSFLSLTAIPASTSTSTLPLFSNGGRFTGQEFRFLSTSLSNLEPFQYIVVHDKGDHLSSGFMIAEFMNKDASIETVHTSTMRLLFHGLRRVRFPKKPTMISTLRLPNIDNSLLAYNLKVKGGSCKDAKFQPMMKQSNWASHEDKFVVNIAEKVSGLDINFHGDLPYHDKVQLTPNNGIELHFWRDPNCHEGNGEGEGEPLSLKLTVDKYGSLGKVVIRYRTIILVFTFMVVILTLRKQFKDDGRDAVSFRPFGVIMNELLITGTYLRFSILLVLFAAYQYSSKKRVVELYYQQHDPQQELHGKDLTNGWFEDALLGRNESFFWLLLPIFFHVSVGIVAFVWFVLNTMVQLVAPCFHVLYTVVSRDTPYSRAPWALILAVLAVGVPYQFLFIVIFIWLLSVNAGTAFAASTATNESGKVDVGYDDGVSSVDGSTI